MGRNNRQTSGLQVLGAQIEATADCRQLKDVLMPTYNDPHDLVAKQKLQAAFPGRTVQFDAIETTVHCDNKLIGIAVRHLIENSLRHASSSDTIRVQVRANSIIVEDDGGGFSDELIRLSKHRFTVAPSTTGSGLGLPTVQMIAQLHGGQLILEKHEPNFSVATLVPGN